MRRSAGAWSGKTSEAPTFPILTGLSQSPRPYIPDKISLASKMSSGNIWNIIHRGSMPELQDPNIDWDFYYSDYVAAYLERDVRDLVNVKDEVKTSATVGRDAVKNFTCLDGLSGYEIGFGHVVCQTPEPYLITKDVQAIPVWGI